MSLRNGLLPASLLAPIPWAPTEYLRGAACSALIRLNYAYRVRFGRDLVINDAYRSLATQQAYWTNPPSGAGTAAWPGTSIHGWGLAVDLGGMYGTPYAWMMLHAPAYGWVNPAWARDGNPANGAQEPWHWEWTGDLADTPPLNPTPPTVIPTPTQTTEVDVMFIALSPAGAGVMMLSNGTWGWVASGASYAQMKAAGIPDVGRLDEGTFSSIFTPGTRRTAA